jgi:MFS transporter, ACS family, allantoate permease
MAIMFTLRTMMKRENARRDREAPDTTYDDMYIERVDSDGKVKEVKVDKVGYFILIFVACSRF